MKRAMTALGGSIQSKITLVRLAQQADPADGAGTALLEAVAARARATGVRRLILVTTNDNIRAIRFYQKRGWDMAALHANAVAAARRIKPEIPLLGDHGIPIRHEIEFERLLA